MITRTYRYTMRVEIRSDDLIPPMADEVLAAIRIIIDGCPTKDGGTSMTMEINHAYEEQKGT